MTDPISDMLNRIRNAQAVLKETVVVPFSNLKYEIAKILEAQGFIEKVEKKKKGTQKSFEITLKYIKSEKATGGYNLKPAVSSLKRLSKPGQRIYFKRHDIKSVLGGHGIAVISTAKGLMTDKEARKNNLGGEAICEIW